MDLSTLQHTYRAAVQHHQAGRLAEAEALYRRILAEHPDHADSLQMLGVLAHQAGHSDPGIRLLQKAIALNPNQATYHANLGVVLGATNRLDEAIVCYRRALELSPDYAEALGNLGTLLQEKDQPLEAVQLLARAAALRPGSAQAHADLGIVLRELGRLDEATAEFQGALSIQPQNPTARWSLGFTHLLKGEFKSGWPGLEARWAMKGLDPRRGFAQPSWDGSDLGGRRILLWVEQGLGDTIQFARYVPLILARGGRPLIQCQPELQRLLQSMDRVQKVIGFSDESEPFDLHAPFMSLPRLFKTTLSTIPSEVPYLNADPQPSGTWKARLSAAGPGLKVGLVWAGSGTHKNDRRRSLALADLAPLAQVPGVRFVSLQKGPAAQQMRPPPNELALLDWTESLGDLADTAALIGSLDLVITVDTAVAHLAGALAKPVWVLLPFSPDWRWMLERADSPWYPTMRLFRQPRPGDWRSVLGEIQARLRDIGGVGLQSH
ncbi:MAG TPA: tetratricopeptide repeat protein [Tepidisphaeraceae bacterium]|nr:tetratricopeptide repeat protein [Tepidisphaeraceae bacterium]